MSPESPGNFEFVEDYDRRVAQLARHAEHYVHTDPDSCLFKLRLMIETMARRLVEMQMPQLVSSDLSYMLRSLERSGTLSRREADGMHAIRRDGNAAVHGELIPPPTAMRRLRDAYGLAAWYCRMVRRGAKVKVRVDAFVPPKPPKSIDQKTRDALARAEVLEDEIEQRRQRTREALLLFGGEDDVERETARLRSELTALDRVAAAAGEPLVDAESVALIMAMEIEQLLDDPRYGLTSREAREAAGRQLEGVKHALDEQEQAYTAERTRLAAEVLGADESTPTNAT